MKKISKMIFIALILAFSTMFLSACDLDEDEINYLIENSGEIAEFFPFLHDTLFAYQGDQDTRLNQIAFAGFIEGNMMQRIVHQGAVSTTEVFVHEGGELRLTFANPVVYDFINVMDEPANLDLVILREPLVVGNSWSMTGMDTTEIVSMDTEVITPAGTFEAMRVVTTYVTGDQMISYFARDVGLVRQVVVWDGEESAYSLFSIVERTQMEMTLPIHWVDGVTFELNSTPVALRFSTNDDVLSVLADALRTAGDNFGPLLTPNTAINKITIDAQTGSQAATVHFDISSDFIEELDLSREEEDLKLQMLANTVGNFFVVQRFVITVDGEAYSSENVNIAPGDFIVVERIEFDYGFGAESIINAN